MDFYHFSVDDVFDTLVPPEGVPPERVPPEVGPAGASDVETLEQDMLEWLHHCQRAYGTRTALYVFYRKRMQDRWRYLCETPSPIREHLAQAQWLSLGAHALDHDTPPYEQSVADQIEMLQLTYEAIDQLVVRKRHAAQVRLHYFSECYEAAPALAAHGVQTLLLTDKPAYSYRLASAQVAELKALGRTCYNGLQFLRSHFRLEHLAEQGYSQEATRALLDQILAQHGFVVFFTHEIDLLRDPRVRMLGECCFEHLRRRGICSA